MANEPEQEGTDEAVDVGDALLVLPFVLKFTKLCKGRQILANSRKKARESKQNKH